MDFHSLFDQNSAIDAICKSGEKRCKHIQNMIFKGFGIKLQSISYDWI
jgi:hypothetical protein